MTNAARLVAVCAALAAALPAAADTLSPSEAATLPRLIDSLCLELVDTSNGCEQAILIASEADPDQADLIVMRDWRTQTSSDPLLIARGIAFSGSIWGAAPWLEEAQDGALLLRSEQSGIGRYPWFQTLTITRDEGGFIVSAFSYSSYDRPAGGSMACSVDFLTGDFDVSVTRVDPETEEESVVLDEAGRIDPVRIAPADWSGADTFPAPCDRGFAVLSAD